MADYESTGNALKKLIKMGRKQPMPFAFCPGSGDDAIFATHLKKSPEIISKAARKDSSQNKVAFGTFTLEGKVITLVMEKELPAVAKKLKKHLRGEGLNLNIKVLDASGNELESDIEDLPDDADDAEDDDAAEQAPETQADEPPADPDEASPQQQADTAELLGRVRALQPGVTALPGDAGDKLRNAVAGILALIKAQKTDQAAETLTSVERAYEKLSEAAAKAEADNAATHNAETAEQASRLARLMQTVQTIDEPVRSKMLGGLKTADAQLDAGEPGKAAKTMNPIEQALGRIAQQAENAPAPPQASAAEPAETAQAEAAPEPAEATEPEVKEAATTSPALAEKWALTEAKLEPAVLAAIAAGKGDANAIRLKFYAMQDLAAAGNHKAALAQAGDLTAQLREAQAAPPVSFAEIPADVVPFAKSRLIWSSTRSDMRAQIGRLKNAMDTALSGVEGMESALGETGRLFGYLDKLDERLEQVLDDLTTTADGPERQALKARARGIIGEYSTELENEFFRDADADNGFVQISLRGPAVSALQRIGAVLAA